MEREATSRAATRGRITEETTEEIEGTEGTEEIEETGGQGKIEVRVSQLCRDVDTSFVCSYRVLTGYIESMAYGVHREYLPEP